MRIIADRKDYYDCIMGMAHDDSIIYVRKEEEVQFQRPCWPAPRQITNEPPWPFPEFYPSMGYAYIVGFCGKIYPLIEFFVFAGQKKIMCFNIEDVDKHVEQFWDKRDRKYYADKKKQGHWFRHGSRRVQFEAFFDECQKNQNAFAEMFLKKRSPIFVAYKYVLTWNAMLNEHEFYRVFDPYRAFQEIEMFMGNMAVPMKPIPQIDDEMKVQTHGFDKWSFRTPRAGS